VPKVGVVLIGVIWGGLGCSVANNGGGSYLQAGVDQGRGGSNGGGNTSVGSGGTIVPGECTLNCGNPAAGSCSSPQVRITEIDVGVTVVNNESETELMPLALAAIPSGGSRLAWMGSDDRVYVARLDCEDQLVGSPFSFPAHDFKDIGADNAGGVVVLTRAIYATVGPIRPSPATTCSWLASTVQATRSGRRC
jgi:hypothetical protein